MKEIVPYPTIREESRQIGLSEPELRRMLQEGRLPGFYVGKKQINYRVDHYALIEQLKCQSSVAPAAEEDPEPSSDVSGPQSPPIDILKAVILERKMELALSYDDLAETVGIQAPYLRKLITKQRTDDWNPRIRRLLCNALGLEIESTVQLIKNGRVKIE